MAISQDDMELVDRSTMKDLEYVLKMVTGKPYISSKILDNALNNLKENTDYGETGLYHLEDIQNTVLSMVNNGEV